MKTFTIISDDAATEELFASYIHKFVNDSVTSGKTVTWSVDSAGSILNVVTVTQVGPTVDPVEVTTVQEPEMTTIELPDVEPEAADTGYTDHMAPPAEELPPDPENISAPLTRVQCNILQLSSTTDLECKVDADAECSTLLVTNHRVHSGGIEFTFDDWDHVFPHTGLDGKIGVTIEFGHGAGCHATLAVRERESEDEECDLIIGKDLLHCLEPVSNSAGM